MDEAHNLIERGRGMYSAELDQSEFNALRKVAAGLKGVLERVGRHWNQMHRDQEVDYQIYPTVPDLFIAALQKAVSAITDHLTDQPTGNEAELLRFYLDAMLFCRLAEAYGPHSLFDITRHDGSGQRTLSTLCLRNVVPAPFLAERFEVAHSAPRCSPPRAEPGELLRGPARPAGGHQLARSGVALPRRAVGSPRAEQPLHPLPAPRGQPHADQHPDEPAVPRAPWRTTWPSSAATPTCSRRWSASPPNTRTSPAGCSRAA